ncbi:hypothetical protein [Thalassobacillus sp. CUG 92003]|nr:hypothetical protein [Thalassobacillus sp. CUG 92003]
MKKLSVLLMGGILALAFCFNVVNFDQSEFANDAKYPGFDSVEDTF